MALKKIISVSGKTIIQSNFGPVQLPDAFVELNCYCKVVSVDGGKDGADIKCLMQDKAKNAAAITSYRFTPSVADGAKNFIAQAYEHLKTLPEFADAVDC
jgi:hypothetical protein